MPTQHPQADELDGKVAQLESLDGRASQLDALQTAEEERLAEMKREVQVLKDHIFRRAEVLGELRRKERDLIAEITGGQSQSKNLQVRMGGGGRGRRSEGSREERGA